MSSITRGVLVGGTAVGSAVGAMVGSAVCTGVGCIEGVTIGAEVCVFSVTEFTVTAQDSFVFLLPVL